MSELSRRILQRRLELGLSQEELAQRMGYRSKSSITKLEKGVNDIPQSKVEEFAAALETTPAWLMGLENTAFVPPGFEPLPEMVRVPLVGSIACGSPITAEPKSADFRFVTGIHLLCRPFQAFFQPVDHAVLLKHIHGFNANLQLRKG